MIKLEFSLAVGLYIFITVCLVLLIWVIIDLRKKTKSTITGKNYFWECSICMHTYLDSINKVISKCPKCESYNKR